MTAEALTPTTYLRSRKPQTELFPSRLTTSCWSSWCVELGTRLVRFESLARVDADRLTDEVLASDRAEGEIAGIPARLPVTNHHDPIIFAVAVSMEPIVGPLSGLEFHPTNERFLLLAQILEDAACGIGGSALAEAPNFEFPGGMTNEGGLLIAMQRPPAR